LFAAMRPVCVLVHEQSVRFSHALSVDPQSSVVDVVVRTQCEALDALLRVVNEHTAADAAAAVEFAACAEYGLTAVLPMLTVRYEPSSLTAIEQATQCRTLALNVVERLLRPVATLAPTTFVDVLWIVTGYVATPVVAGDAASLRVLRAAAVQCAQRAAGLCGARRCRRRRCARCWWCRWTHDGVWRFYLSQLLAVAADTHDREISELALVSARLLLQCIGASVHDADARACASAIFGMVLSWRCECGDARCAGRLQGRAPRAM
jgi:hypothetical protein